MGYSELACSSTPFSHYQEFVDNKFEDFKTIGWRMFLKVHIHAYLNKFENNMRAYS